MSTPIKIAITPGEPAGIGPDLIIKLAQEAWRAQLVVFADGEMLKARASALGLPLTLIDYDATNPQIQDAGSLFIKQIDKSVDVTPGELDSENGLYVVETLRQACQANMDGDFDAVVACYHDQGLIPVKMIAFGRAVNITLGLPVVRTSVDHGTANDIAGKGIADPSSMIEAVRLAAHLASVRGTVDR